MPRGFKKRAAALPLRLSVPNGRAELVAREPDEVHIWRFDDDGKVASFCHKVDSYQHWRALQSS